jgi:ribonuclease HI
MKARNWRARARNKCKDRRLWIEIAKQAKTHQGFLRRTKKKGKEEVFKYL